MLSYIFRIVFLFQLWNKSFGKHVRMESLLPRPTLTKLRKSPALQEHDVVIAIHQPNIDLIEETLLARSTPGSPMYQQWLSFDEVGDFIRNDAAVSAVEQWLQENGAKVTWKTVRSEYIKAVAPLSIWEQMLDTQFYEWEDTSDPRRAQSYHLAEHYSIPHNLHQHIYAILNTAQSPPVINKYAQIKGKEGLFKTNLRVDQQPTNSHESIQANKVTISYLDTYYKIGSNAGLFFCYIYPLLILSDNEYRKRQPRTVSFPNK